MAKLSTNWPADQLSRRAITLEVGGTKDAAVWWESLQIGQALKLHLDEVDMIGNEGKIIGDYRVLDTLGSGAAGEAFRAEHKDTGEVVVLKLMHQRLQSDPDIQNRFVREVSVLQKLSHPNIVRYVDCGLDDGRLYLAMEWVEFGTLDEVLKRRSRLPWRETVESAVQICSGLEHAHERGIIHRDLKPANLFLSGDGLIKIGDFGLARDGELHRLTVSGNTVGTCRYMAPEQVRGEDVLTGAVDMYAVGCLLFRMLVGRPPYDGANIMEIFEHHLYSDIPPLGPAVDGRPPELDALVTRLLTKDPAERPGKANEVREALVAILSGGEVATEFTSVVPVPSESEADSQVEQVKEVPNLTHRLVHDDRQEAARTVNWGALVAVMGLAVMLALIVFWARGQ